jgi:ubiquitin-activating enzyme E1 C
LSAACANEAFKLATSCFTTVNNYMMYVGDEGIYTHTFELERKPECPVCGSNSIKITVPKSWTLQELIDSLMERRDVQLKKPSLRSASTSLYMRAPAFLEQATRPNLEKKLEELLVDGDSVVVTDEALPVSIELKVTLQ